MSATERASRAALDPIPAAIACRRRPAEVMRLARLGSFHPTRLSFLQSLLRQLERERWTFARRAWQVDDAGVGHALYTVQRGERAYTLVCFAHDLPPEQRSDRVIATAWDATFALHDGIPTADDVVRLRANVPRQEAGRVSSRELTLSRANRSVRLFEHVVERLATGRQPDHEPIEATGYLMRTTAVYGSGKFGAADRSRIASRPELGGPFRAEMLTVWLIRAFTVDLVEHLARVRGGERAVRLDAALRRRLGVGNSTGLGMAPFLINHPVLLNNWILAREEALARVRALSRSSASTRAAFRKALSQARDNAIRWQTDHPVQRTKLAALRRDLARLAARTGDVAVRAADTDHSDACTATGPGRQPHGAGDDSVRTGRSIDMDCLDGPRPWDALWRWGETQLSHEGQEALVSLLLEPHGTLVDELADCMDADEAARFRIDGDMPVRHLRDLIAEHYDWALAIDHTAREQTARFWYVSEEKLEPRLGERHTEPGAEFEQPLAIARDVARLAIDLDHWRGGPDLAAFLGAHPEHRHVVRRVQITARCPLAEIRDNLLAVDLLPIDLLRCKLSFFGASRFDPRSDRWVRICLFEDTPQPDELLSPAVMSSASNDPTEPTPPGPCDAALTCLTVSLNEIDAMCRKAARGAGYEWGLAEEAGGAARRLAGWGFPGPEALLATLDAIDGHPRRFAPAPGGESPVPRDAIADAVQWQAADAFLCPIATGSALSDHAGLLSRGCVLTLVGIHRPILLLPFLYRAAHDLGTRFRLTATDLGLFVDASGVTGEVEKVPHTVDRLTVACHDSPHPRVTAIIGDTTDCRSVSVDVWRALERYALRTCVPTSDTSRSGAGARVSDSD